MICFRFVEEFSRVIGVAKADVAARESAVNNESTAQQASSSSNQPANSNAANEAQPPANVEQIPLPEGELENRVEIDAANLMEDDFDHHEEEEHEDEEIDAEHEHLDHGMDYNDDFHENIEDDYEEGEPEMMYNENQARSNSSSSSSSSESNDGGDREHQPGDEQQNALNQLNEAVSNAEANNAELVRNLEQLNNGLNEVEMVFHFWRFRELNYENEFKFRVRYFE